MNILSWLVAGVAGWFWVDALLPHLSAPAWIRRSLAASLAMVFGVGATASLFFALLWAGARPPVAAWTSDTLVLASGIVTWLVLRRRQPAQLPPEPSRPVPLAWLGGIAAVVSLAGFLAAVAVVLNASPQGDWDAWSIWNVRAKFLAHEGLWRNAVSPDLSESRPGYPLLWSAAVARVWSQSGAIAQSAPQTGAFLMSLALVLIFASALAVRGGWHWAALGAATLLMSTPVWRTAIRQYADVPLTAMILASVVSAALAQRASWSPASLTLSGAFASMAAFTKHEGLAFCIFLAITVAAVSRLRALWWLAGAAPALLLTVAFHLFLAPEARILRPEHLRDAGRFWSVAQGMASELWQLGDFPAHPLLFAALLLFVFRPARPWQPFWLWIPGVLLLLADFVFLWGAPGDASELTRTVGDRLWLHVLPVFLLCIYWRLAQAEPSPATVPSLPEEKSAPKPRSAAKR
ncbi:MAG: hypothetical protein WHT08_15740 [Bryobacteraceae bacterium]